jgi:hypothetical protein
MFASVQELPFHAARTRHRDYAKGRAMHRRSKDLGAANGPKPFSAKVSINLQSAAKIHLRFRFRLAGFSIV